MSSASFLSSSDSVSKLMFTVAGSSKISLLNPCSISSFLGLSHRKLCTLSRSMILESTQFFHSGFLYSPLVSRVSIRSCPVFSIPTFQKIFRSKSCISLFPSMSSSKCSRIGEKNGKQISSKACLIRSFNWSPLQFCTLHTQSTTVLTDQLTQSCFSTLVS